MTTASTRSRIPPALYALAIGAFAHDLGLTALPWAAALVTVVGITPALLAVRSERIRTLRAAVVCPRA